jgi:hypothetical protein
MKKRLPKPEKKNTGFTTWKINLENTINADPMADGECLKIARAYLDYLGGLDARPYRSLIDLQVATSLAENTIIDRRRKLVTLGYFKADGKTSDGATRYQILNARENIVLDHQTISRETLRGLAAEKKEKNRLKRLNAQSGPSRHEGLSPSQYEGLNPVWPLTACGDSPSRHEGNCVYNSVEAISMEEEGYLTDDIVSAELDPDLHLETKSNPSTKIDPPQNSYALETEGDDYDQPLPIPDGPSEADEMMDAICEGRSVHRIVRDRLRSMLMDGLLTVARVENILGSKREQAA